MNPFTIYLLVLAFLVAVYAAHEIKAHSQEIFHPYKRFLKRRALGTLCFALKDLDEFAETISQRGDINGVAYWCLQRWSVLKWFERNWDKIQSTVDKLRKYGTVAERVLAEKLAEAQAYLEGKKSRNDTGQFVREMEEGMDFDGPRNAAFLGFFSFDEKEAIERACKRIDMALEAELFDSYEYDEDMEEDVSSEKSAFHTAPVEAN